MIDLSRSRLPPYDHQRIGVEALVKWDDTLTGRIIGGVFYLGDEMGAGKTKQVIDAAQVLADWGLINQVVIIAPAAVRAVWFDPELGELTKHLWANFPCTITEYHAKTRTWNWFIDVKGEHFKPKLRWVITNYDFIRSPDRLKALVKSCDDNTMLVLDEASAIKNWKALQTKACREVRHSCSRIVELNGTPISNGPGDLYSQADVMDPKILACKSYFHFRARYALMGGWQGKQIIGWRDLPDLQQRMAPYVLRRLKSQCIDLPPKLDPVIMAIPMDPPTWKMYKQMRDDMVAWLSDTTLSSASQAIVKVIRLSQITSGFVGGIEEQPREEEERPDFIEKLDDSILDPTGPKPTVAVLQEVGREKLDALLNWLEDQLQADPGLKLLVWSRFRAEVQRLHREICLKFPHISLGMIWGGQKRPDREVALRLLDPRTMPEGPVVVIGTPASGSMGLNLTGAHTVIYMSNDFSLKTRLQSEDRVHRPGQIYPVSYFDMIATGPQGQKTIDHAVVKALQSKQDLADFTTSAWISALVDE